MPRMPYSASNRINEAFREGPRSWAELIDATRISKAALSANLRRLITEGLVQRKGTSYLLTFKGFVHLLASVPIPREPNPVSSDETGEDFVEHYQKDMRIYKERNRELKSLFETWGRVLGYPLFQESATVEKVMRKGLYSNYIRVAQTMVRTPRVNFEIDQSIEDNLKRDKELIQRGFSLMTNELADITVKGQKAVEWTIAAMRSVEERVWKEDFAIFFSDTLAAFSKGKNVPNQNLAQYFKKLAERKAREFQELLLRLNDISTCFGIESGT